MNHAPSSKPAILARSIAALLCATVLHQNVARAADGTWLGLSGIWSDPLVWAGGNVADGADFTANFTGVNITAAQTITLDTARTLGNVTFTDATTASHNLTISGANTLTLDVTTGAPVINVTNQVLAISSVIDGVDGLTKNGAGSLTLSGANAYTGLTNINNGTVTISQATALGAISEGTVIASGGQVFTGTASLASAEAFSIAGTGVTATGAIRTGGSATGVVFSGAITLSAAATIQGDGSTGTTFSGGITLGSNTLTFGVGGGGTTTIGTTGISGTGSVIKSSLTGILNLNAANTYTGTTTISGGTLSLGHVAALGGTTAITIAGAATLSTSTDGIVIGVPITLGTTGTNSNIAFSRSTANVGTFTLNSVISGAGNLVLTTPNVNSGGNVQNVLLGSANTYAGNTTITTGNINNTTIIKAGVANALPATTTLNINGGNGTGSGRNITYDLNGFDQTLAGLTSVSGLYNRSQRIANSSGTPATLTVNNTTANNFAGRIGLGGTNLSLTKGGAGTLALGGGNSYTGATVVNGGTLALDFTQTGTSSTNAPSNYIAATSPLTLNGGTFSVTGRANGSAVVSEAWTATAATNVSRITFTTLPAGIVVGQAITGTGLPASPFVVAISGNNVILNGNVTAVSGTFSTSATSVTTSQTFAGTTLGAGASGLSIAAGGNGTTLSLGAITRNAGGTVDFTQPAGTISATNGFKTTTANTNGILGGWATVGGTDWATNNGTNIVAFAAYTLTSVAGTTAGNYTNNHIDVDNSAGLLSGAITPDTLRFNSAAAQTVTLAAGTNTVSGGILVTGTVGGNVSTLTGGTLRGASGQDLVVIQNNTASSLAIASIIADNTTATGLSKSGAGTVVLSGANTYTGPTSLNAGALSAGSTSHLGAATANLVFNGGTLQVTGTALTNISGLGHTVLFNANKTVGLDIADAANTFTVNQALNQGAGGFTKLGAGTAILNQPSTYTGATTVGGGTLRIVGANQLNSGAYPGAIALGTGATFQYSSSAVQTLSGVISGDGGLLKDGTGDVILSAVNTYTGPTTVNAGTLQIVGAGQLNSGAYSGAIALGTGATLRSSSSALQTLSGGIGGAGGILKDGTGDLTFSAASTYSGGTSIAAGIVAVTTSDTALGTGLVAINGGVRLTVETGLNVANAITLGTNAGVTGRGLVEPSGIGTATVSGPVTINNGTLAGGHFATSGATSILHVAGPITSSVPVAVRIGTVMFSGGGTGYTALTVGAGTTLVGADNGIATTAIASIATSAAATLDLNGFNQSLAGILKGGFAATIGNSSTTADATLTLTGTSSYAGTIVDALDFGTMKTNVTVSSGALTLTANNPYTGVTTVNGGMLNLNGILGAGANVVNANAGATNFSVSQTLGALNIGAGATVTFGATASPAEGKAAAAFDDREAIGAEFSVDDGAAGTGAVPEPGSIALLLTALPGLAGRRRRQA